MKTIFNRRIPGVSVAATATARGWFIPTPSPKMFRAGVNIVPSHDLNGLKIAANVYTPADYDRDEVSALVVAAYIPTGALRSNLAGLYGQRMAELGLYLSGFRRRLSKAPARANQ